MVFDVVIIFGDSKPPALLLLLASGDLCRVSDDIHVCR